MKIVDNLLKSLVLLVFLTSSASSQDIKNLLDKIQNLEDRLVTLERKVASQGSGNDEQEINDFRKITSFMSQEKYSEATIAANTFIKKYPTSKRAASAKKFARELSVFNKVAPSNWGIEKWLQGEKDIILDNSKTTLLVFWEVWCPHCRREVPKIDGIYNELKDDGLQVLGLTKLSRGSTEKQVKDFMTESKLSYPVAKEDGSLSRYFAVSGVPAAAVVKGDTVVWRGHPARLNQDKLKGWMK